MNKLRYLLLSGFFFLLFGDCLASADTIERGCAIVGDEFILQSELESSGLALDEMIERVMLLSYAKEEAIAVDAEKIEKELSRARQAFPHLTEADLKARLEEEFLISMLKMKTCASISEPLSNEIKRYYDEHHNEFVIPSEVSLSQIVLSKGKKFEDVEQELKNGADFAEIARRYSDGPMAKNGGHLGFVPLASLIPEIKSVVAGLDIGEMSRPVNVGDKVHIIKLEGRRQSFLKSLDEVRVKIRELLYRKDVDRLWDGFVKELKEKTYIKIIAQ